MSKTRTRCLRVEHFASAERINANQFDKTGLGIKMEERLSEEAQEAKFSC